MAWHIYIVEYYSAKKKNEIMPSAATWMGLQIIILGEVNQTEKDKYHTISLICGNLTYGTDELIYETGRLTDVENRCVVAKGQGRVEGWIGSLGLADTN